MKKLLVAILFMCLPLNMMAYSNKVIPGGENIGIDIQTRGITIVGFYKVDDKYIGSKNLKVGDTILEINGNKVNSIDDVSSLIKNNIIDDQVNIKILRNNEKMSTKMDLVYQDGIYKTGLYIKEKLTGIGTISYIDPISKVYGSLGHSVEIKESTNDVEVRSGDIYRSYVNGIDRSVNGSVGAKSASIDYNDKIGNILSNNNYGIYGIYSEILPRKDLIDIANIEEVSIGDAYIITTLNSDELNNYKIKITKINNDKLKTNMAFSFEIIDSDLLDRTGGIIQGMSGSPIIQNNKLIGAVTHVVIDDVTKGYAIYIKTMLEEGDKLR